MQLFVNGKLNPAVFELNVLRATHDLRDALSAAAETDSALVESTHFLMALSQLAGGVLEKSLSRRQLTREHWRQGLAQCAVSAAGKPPTQLDERSLDGSARSMLQAAQARCGQLNLSRISEGILLRYGLEHATSAVRELCNLARIDLDAWRQELEDQLAPPSPLAVFAEESPHPVRLDQFTASGKKVLRLMQREAEAMGYREVDARHLLLGLLSCDGGMTQFGLHAQGIKPEKVHAGVMLSLRMGARAGRSSAPLNQEHLQTLVRHMLLRAAEFAGQARTGGITEAHLLQGFLSVESAARRLLDDHRVDANQLRAAADAYDPTIEQMDDDETVADIDTVRRRLEERLVGQDRAIDQILPYVELMRFDFRTPGRPVGVFLFCGPSGSGKTELAKALAHAVYGSEDNLIFLEMGQFNSPESMNIFVGAPPGYIGYGQGKLTNGLRDKPRAVVLFDEVEKAESRVLDALLRFLDEGRIDDPAGPVRDGSECIVILTSNEAAQEVAQLEKDISDNPNWRTELRQRLREIFAKDKYRVLGPPGGTKRAAQGQDGDKPDPGRPTRPKRRRKQQALFEKRGFRVEFLNRVDEILLFRRLSQSDYAEIARRQLARIVDRLKEEHQIEVAPDKKLVELIGTYCEAVDEGARAVPRLLKTVVILPVCRFVAQNTCPLPVKVRVFAERAAADPACEPTGIVDFAD